MTITHRERQFTAARIRLLRNEFKLTQSEFASKVSEIMNRDKPYNYVVVTMWENNRRMPNTNALNAIATLFDVSVDYLLGRTENRKEIIPKLTKMTSPLADVGLEAIKYTELVDYNEKPIYCVFPNKTRRDGWALYNSSKEQLVFTDATLPASTAYLYYKNATLNSFNALTLLNTPINNIERLLGLRNVWIEMLSNDPSIKNLYDGWYKHNETHSCLINVLGLALPYEGLNLSYRAYDGYDY